MINWTEVIRTLVSVGIIVTAAGWITRTAVTTWLSKRLDDHKNALMRQAETQLEAFKQELRIEEARQSRLLERQAKVVAGVYARLDRLHQAMKELAAPVNLEGGGFVALRDKAIQEFNSFSGYYFDRGIWLEEATCEFPERAAGSTSQAAHRP